MFLNRLRTHPANVPPVAPENFELLPAVLCQEIAVRTSPLAAVRLATANKSLYIKLLKAPDSPIHGYIKRAKFYTALCLPPTQDLSPALSLSKAVHPRTPLLVKFIEHDTVVLNNIDVSLTPPHHTRELAVTSQNLFSLKACSLQHGTALAELKYSHIFFSGSTMDHYAANIYPAIPVGPTFNAKICFLPHQELLAHIAFSMGYERSTCKFLHIGGAAHGQQDGDVVHFDVQHRPERPTQITIFCDPDENFLFLRGNPAAPEPANFDLKFDHAIHVRTKTCLRFDLPLSLSSYQEKVFSADLRTYAILYESHVGKKVQLGSLALQKDAAPQLTTQQLLSVADAAQTLCLTTDGTRLAVGTPGSDVALYTIGASFQRTPIKLPWHAYTKTPHATWEPMLTFIESANMLLGLDPQGYLSRWSIAPQSTPTQQRLWGLKTPVSLFQMNRAKTHFIFAQGANSPNPIPLLCAFDQAAPLPPTTPQPARAKAWHQRFWQRLQTLGMQIQKLARQLYRFVLG